MKAIKYMAVAGMAALAASCSDFLEEYSQSSYYAESWEDLDELLVGSGYVQPEVCGLMSTHPNFGSFMHYLADELEENNISEDKTYVMGKPYTFGYFTWQQRAGQNQDYTDYYEDNTEWAKAYHGINLANNILAALPSMPRSTDEEIRGCGKVSGETHFLRAYFYFWLVNMYGQPYNAATASTDLGVPVKTTENVEDRKFMRNTVQEAYDLIVSDLQAAREGFRTYDTEKRSIYRADSTAANLLLSRVYLYMGRWQDCMDAADRVLDAHPALMQLNGNSSPFAVSTNVENIFSMGGSDLPVQMQYAYQSYRVNTALYNLYGSDDLRRSQWFWHRGYFTGLTKVEQYNVTETDHYDPSELDYYYELYVHGWGGRMTSVSSVFLLRSAEAYLNKAEAAAYLGREAEAREALNHLRAYRYRTGTAEVTASGEELVKEIRTERRKEFVLEGQRWFDLRRYRVCPVCPERVSLTHDYTFYVSDQSIEKVRSRRYVLEAEDPSWTMPIPYSVLEFNTGMPSNGNPVRMGVEIPVLEN
mgnify:CR=1 FL=1